MNGTEFVRPAAGRSLPRITPAQAGVREEDIMAMIREYADKRFRINSFILVRNGGVYAEGYYKPYDPMQPQTVYSLSKSFTSAAVGIAQGEGILTLDERIVDIFADEVKEYGIEPDEKLSSMTVRSLLCMSTGQEAEIPAKNVVKMFLKNPCHEMPGELFRYNSMATYLCSAILKKKGIDLEEYLTEKLFQPMGVEGMHWQRCSRGICTGGFGLSILPEVIAKFGVLLLQNGNWEGRQLIPKEYLDLATSKQIENNRPESGQSNRDWTAGYGFQFWQCANGSFRGDGMAGQFCVVNREKQAVLAMTAYENEMQEELNVYFKNILDRMQDGPIEEDSPAGVREELHTALSGLTNLLRPVEDDGGELPAEVFDREIRIAGRGKLRLTRSGDRIEAKQNGAGTIVLTRGNFLDQQVFLTNEMMVGQLPDSEDPEDNVISTFPHETRVLAGYGMRGGILTIRVFVPEMLVDMRYDVVSLNDEIRADAYDVHAPRKE